MSDRIVERLKYNPNYELNIGLTSMRIIEDALIELYDAIEAIEIGDSAFTATEISNLKSVSAGWTGFNWVYAINYVPTSRSIQYSRITPYNGSTTTTSVVLPLVSSTVDGLMSSVDKIKLDNLSSFDLSNYYTKDEVDTIIANLVINFITIEI